jgi:hypothetical protein
VKRHWCVAGKKTKFRSLRLLKSFVPPSAAVFEAEHNRYHLNHRTGCAENYGFLRRQKSMDPHWDVTRPEA